VATAAAIPAGAATQTIPLVQGATLTAAPPPATVNAFTPARFAALGVGVFTLVIAGLLWMRPSPRRAPERPVSSSVTPAAAFPEGANLPASQTFGRYQLVRKLGSGGMAEVYLARVVGEAGFAKDVALKIMHKSLSSMPEVVDHFLDEARLATRLNHPNIVQIIDLGKQGDDYYIAMEYVDGYDRDYLLDSSHRRSVQWPVRIGRAIRR